MIEGNGVYASMGTTVFEAVSGLARQLGAINLGQGFPDGNGPPELLDAAARAFRDRSSQYPPSAGLPELRTAVADFYRRRQGLALSPDQVIVTSGATEGLADALLALVRPGDEVIVLTPAYDSYAPMIRRAGGVPVFVPLAAPAFRLDPGAIAAAVSPATRGIIVNDPLNPAGTVAGDGDMAGLAALCAARDLWAISDEVWEEVRFDGSPHRSLMTYPGMAERCVKIGSAGKLFGLTGWKIGWMIAAPALAPLLARAHQFLTFTSAPGLQWAVADGLALPDAWFAAQNAGWAASRQRLRAGLESAGLAVLPNAATWFLCADLAASGLGLNDAEFADRAIREAGVATIPVSAFCEGAGGPEGLVRFCFTKPDAMLDEACERLARFVSALAR